MTIKFRMLSRFCVVGLLVWMQACAGNPLGRFNEKPYFTEPQAQMTREDKDLFDRALYRQENNRIQPAIMKWKQFLQKHPRSFEAHNNLGLVYFEDDQVDASIAEFETALSLEPNDSKIKKNLVRVLKFKSTLLNEAKDYNGAVDFLQRAQEFSSPRQKERIGFIVEKFEDKIFEQAKQTNTLEAYEGFLKRFPNSGKKADEARTKIAGLKPLRPRVDETALDGMQMEDPSTSPDSMDEAMAPAMDSMSETGMEKSVSENMEDAASAMGDVVQESTEQAQMDMDDVLTPAMDSTPETGMEKSVSESMEDASSAMNEGVSALKDDGEQALDTAEKTIEEEADKILETTEKAENVEERPLIDNLHDETVPEKLQEAVRSVEKPIAIATQPEPKPSSGTELFSDQEPPPEVANLFDDLEQSQPKKKFVEIVTRKDPLRVREEPTLTSRVLATVDKGSQFLFVTEKNGWYKVEFSAGQSGWVSKKFSRLVE